MPTTAEVEEFSTTTRLIVGLGLAQLADYMATNPAPDEIPSFYADLVERFGRAMASIAADWYDDLRANAGVRRGYSAEPAEPVPAEQSVRVAYWAMAPRPASVAPDESVDESTPTSDVTFEPIDFDDAAESLHSNPLVDDDLLADLVDVPELDEPELEDVPELEPDEPEDIPDDEPDEPDEIPMREPTSEEIHDRLSRSLQRLAMQPARDTIARSAERDPAEARWARVPQGEITCAFCLVMASRGGVYLSEASASQVVGRRGRTRGKRSLGDSYHDSCDCIAVPIWDEDDYPEHYDPDTLYDIYSDARDAVHGADLRTIVAELRRQHPHLH